ncbi:MAG TPA: PH domain-containing protein [Acetobacteraceae bacterium]|nr:PH domain-containing protein [Acetobacteraceae bacterium]
MAYYTKVLQPDEQVRVIGHLHWSIYLRALFVLVIALVVAAGSAWLADPDWQRIALWAAAAIAVIGLLMLFGAWVRRRATEIVVTDRRVIFKRGLVSRHTVEMNVGKIETVDVEQGLGGRLWGYGTVMIHGTGSGFEPLVGIGAPIQIRNAIVAG